MSVNLRGHSRTQSIAEVWNEEQPFDDNVSPVTVCSAGEKAPVM